MKFKLKTLLLGLLLGTSLATASFAQTIVSAAGASSGPLTITKSTTTLSGFTDTDVWFTDGTAIGQSPGLQFTKATGVLKIGNDAGTNSFTLTAGAANLATFQGGVAATSLVLNGGQALSGSIVLSLEGQGLTSGATGTSPGWYAQLDGDTTPRVRIGLNGSDVASVAFGPGNAVRDLFIERAGAATTRFGTGDSATPVAQTIKFQSGATLNTAGVNATIIGSLSSGSGNSGDMIFQTGVKSGVSGTLATPTTALTIKGETQQALFASSISIGGSNANLFGDATNTLSQHNAANAQNFYVYNTFTDASNYERLEMHWGSNNAAIQTSNAGTGSIRSLSLGTTGSSSVFLFTNNVIRWQVDTSGNLISGTDNSYNIGASGATRPATIFAGTRVVSPAYTVGSTAGTSGGPFTVITGITVVNGIVTSISGS